MTTTIDTAATIDTGASGCTDAPASTGAGAGRRRARLLLALFGVIALNGCSSGPFLCAQIGTIGFCA